MTGKRPHEIPWIVNDLVMVFIQHSTWAVSSKQGVSLNRSRFHITDKRLRICMSVHCTPMTQHWSHWWIILTNYHTNINSFRIFAEWQITREKKQPWNDRLGFGWIWFKTNYRIISLLFSFTHEQKWNHIEIRCALSA